MADLLHRRYFMALAAAGLSSGLAGCAGSTRGIPSVGGLFGTASDDGETLSRPDYRAIYADFSGEAYPIEAFDYRRVDPMFLRQIVRYEGGEKPGTIVVDPAARMLYFVEPARRATRYGVGVGREGFAWAGTARINMKKIWPSWVPPQEMVARDPDIQAQLERTPRGMGVNGGPRSPLGARAMYLFGQKGDLGYRIHGTTEPETIGTDVSSGCIRMVNQDIVHLYSRVSLGTTVVVRATRADATRIG